MSLEPANPITQLLTKWMTFNCPGTVKGQPNSGAVVLADDLKSPAMEKLDLVRKWSINTYKVILSVLNCLFPPTLSLLSLLLSFFIISLFIRVLAKKWTMLLTNKDMNISFFTFCGSTQCLWLFPLYTHSTLSPWVFHNALNIWSMCTIPKLAVLHSVLGRSCQRSWVGARGLWTWSWRLKSKCSVTTRESTRMWLNWLRHWPVSCPRLCRHSGSWVMPLLTSVLSHQNSTWVHTFMNI